MGKQGFRIGLNQSLTVKRKKRGVSAKASKGESVKFEL